MPKRWLARPNHGGRVGGPAGGSEGDRRLGPAPYDQMEGGRFRHTAQFVLWRPDRDARFCTYEQLRPRHPDSDEIGCACF